eukprot:Awhi_evm1s14888
MTEKTRSNQAHIRDLDLETPELTATSAVLMASARHYGQYCEAKNQAFLRCRYEMNDPSQCVSEGKAVTNCAIEL